VRDVQDAENMEKRGHTDPLFTQDVPASDRLSRAELVRIANLYFSGMQLDDGKGDYSFFANDCDRVENGSEATNNHQVENSRVISSQSNSVEKASRERSDLTYSASWGCAEQFQSGLLHFVTRIRDRRYVVVDPKRGVALAFAFFDHAAGKTRTFKLPSKKNGYIRADDAVDVGNCRGVQGGAPEDSANRGCVPPGAVWDEFGVEHVAGLDVHSGEMDFCFGEAVSTRARISGRVPAPLVRMLGSNSDCNIHKHVSSAEGDRAIAGQLM
jgi:hypothetical protein